MIEIKFETEEDAQLAVDKLSCLGKIEVEKKVEARENEKIYLISNYEDALLKLKQHPVKEINEYSINALECLKSLFKTKEILENTYLNQSQVDEIILKIARQAGNEKYLEYLNRQEALNRKINKLKEKVFPGLDDDISEKQLAIDIYSQMNKARFNVGKFLELDNLNNFFINPIYDSINMHFPSDDPYTSFMNEVYLDVTEYSDFFDINDLRLRLRPEVHVSYTLNLGLEFILHEDKFVDILYDLPLKNFDIFEKIHALILLTKSILTFVEEINKINYGNLIEEVYELFNTFLIYLDETEVEFNIDYEIIELIIRDLVRMDIIDLKGNKIFKAM